MTIIYYFIFNQQAFNILYLTRQDRHLFIFPIASPMKTFNLMFYLVSIVLWNYVHTNYIIGNFIYLFYYT